MKIVINSDFGGFSLSRKAFLKLRKMKNKYALEEPDIGEKWSDGSGPRKNNLGDHFLTDIPRDDKDLVKVVKELGKKSWGEMASLKIVTVPNGVSWEISEYDGSEHVAETHRTWG